MQCDCSSSTAKPHPWSLIETYPSVDGHVPFTSKMKASLISLVGGKKSSAKLGTSLAIVVTVQRDVKLTASGVTAIVLSNEFYRLCFSFLDEMFPRF